MKREQLKSYIFIIVSILIALLLSFLTTKVTNPLILLLLIVIIITVYTISVLYLNKKSAAEEFQTQGKIINSLGLIYENVFVVNLNDSKISFYQITDDNKIKYEKEFFEDTYENVIEQYVKDEVYEDDINLFDQVSDIKKITQIFEKTSNFSFIYRLLKNGELHYYQAQLLKSEADKDEFVFGVKNVDDIMQKQINDQTKMNNMIEMQSVQLRILSSISSIYLTTHLIDLDKDFLVEINTSKEVSALVTDGENVTQQMKTVISNVIIPEYVERALAFTNLSTIAKRLKGKNIISEEFIGRYHGWVRTSFIPVEFDEEGTPYKILFVSQVIDNEKRKEEILIETAYKDELTGLYNRRAYEDALRLLKATSPAQNFVYVSMDVNGLKITNDNLGHEAGDELLKGAADCISECFSKYGKVFRTGGDEFQAIIYLDNMTSLSDLKEKFSNTVKCWSGNLVEELFVSAGYVSKSEVMDSTINEIVKLADQRMYQAKSQYYINKGIDRRGQQVAYEVLCQSYTKILKINLSKDTFTILKMENDEKVESKGNRESISECLYNFGISGLVHREDKKNYLAKTNIDYLRDYFKKGNKSIIIQYKRKFGKRFYKAMMEIIVAKEYTHYNQVLYLYVKKIDLDR